MSLRGLGGSSRWICTSSICGLPRNGSSAWHCGWVGWLLDRSGQSAEAIPWYRKAIALDPTRAIVRGNLAAILWRQGRQSESLELVRAGIAADPDNRELRLLAVDYLLKADMSGEACNLLKASPPSGPQQIGRVEQFLTALHKDGRRGHFRVLLETLLTAAPQDGTLQRSLGTLLMMDGRFEEAATRLEQAVHLRPQETWAYLELARAYQGLGRLMEAIARLDEALRIDPGLEEAFSRRSYYHRLLGVHDQSLADARRAITLAPQDWGGYWVLRMACLENGDLDGAIGAMREAVAAIPERPESHFWLAADLAAKGLPQEAEQAFRAAIAAAPEDPHYRFRLAQALTHSGVNEATAITQAIDAAPMTLDSCRRLANLCQISEQPQWGVSVAKSCADAFPDDADAHNLWGWKLYQSTRLAEAVSAFERAIELQPLHADAYEGLGLALNGQREWERSVAAWLRAYELDLTRIRCLRRLVETIRLQGNTDQSWTMLLRGSPQAAGWRHEYAQLLVALGTAEDAAIVRSIEFAPLTSDGYGGLANLCGESGRLSWALTVAKARVDAYPDHGAAYNGWGYYLIRNQRHAEAIPVLERAIELSPDLAFAYRDLGTAVRHEGELDRAASAFRRSFELDPRRTESLRDLIEVLARPSRVEELKETIQWAVEHSPGNADVPGTIARTLIVRRGDVGPEFLSLAIASAKAACEADPTNGLRWGLLGAAQLRDGQWPAAIESFTRAEELGPSSPYNWLPLAICCWKSDQRPLARTWLQKTIDAQSAHQADPLAGDPFLVDLLSEATELIVPDDPR